MAGGHGRRRIVILGGGFAGLEAALRLPASVNVTLLDASRWFEFLPNIHELVSGVKTRELLRLPRDVIVRRAGHAFRREAVAAIDPEARTLTTRRGRQLGYDALIVALGGVNATHGVAGALEHALPFKSVDQCAAIGRRLAQLASSARPERPADVVIVGGGLEGVEALGEILRRHRRSKRLRVALVEGRGRLLPEAPPSLDAALRELCAPFGVRFETGARVARVEADAVVLESGERLASGATLWTGGPAAPTLLADCGLAPEPGAWAPVQATLQAAKHPEIFVAGDAAQLHAPLAKQAYHALDMGRVAAENALRHLEGRALRSFRPSAKPMLIAFGDLSCFLVAGTAVLAGPPLAAAKEGVFELVMARLDRQPWHDALGSAAARVAHAARHLLWPSVSSLGALRRQARVSVLSVG